MKQVEKQNQNKMAFLRIWIFLVLYYCSDVEANPLTELALGVRFGFERLRDAVVPADNCGSPLPGGVLVRSADDPIDVPLDVVPPTGIGAVPPVVDTVGQQISQSVPSTGPVANSPDLTPVTGLVQERVDEGALTSALAPAVGSPQSPASDLGTPPVQTPALDGSVKPPPVNPGDPTAAGALQTPVSGPDVPPAQTPALDGSVNPGAQSPPGGAPVHTPALDGSVNPGGQSPPDAPPVETPALDGSVNPGGQSPPGGAPAQTPALDGSLQSPAANP